MAKKTTKHIISVQDLERHPELNDNQEIEVGQVLEIENEVEVISNKDDSIKPYFEMYPDINTFFRTSDGQVFVNSNLRDLHLQSLEQKEFKTYKR